MSEVTFQGTPIRVAGSVPAAGSTAPAFSLVGKDLNELTLADFPGQRKVLNIFPSIDTGVCAASVRKFNELASSLDNTVVLCISADLPFAQSRFCGADGLDKVITLSSFRSPGFLADYGVALAEGALSGLAARAVFVLDADNRILHVERVAEIGNEPDYDAAVAVLG